MEQLNEYAGIIGIIALVLIIVLLGVLIFIFKKVDLVAKNTVENSLIIKSNYCVDTKSASTNLTITIYNPNYRDIQIDKAGFVYLNQEVDYFAELVEQYGTAGRLLIKPRSSVSLKTSIDTIEQFVLSTVTDNKGKIAKIYNLIIDSIGTQKIVYNKTLTKLMKKRHKERALRLKYAIIGMRIESYREKHNGKTPFSQIFLDLFRKVKVTKDGLKRPLIYHDTNEDVKVSIPTEKVIVAKNENESKEVIISEDVSSETIEEEEITTNSQGE